MQFVEHLITRVFGKPLKVDIEDISERRAPDPSSGPTVLRPGGARPRFFVTLGLLPGGAGFGFFGRLSLGRKTCRQVFGYDGLIKLSNAAVGKTSPDLIQFIAIVAKNKHANG